LSLVNDNINKYDLPIIFVVPPPLNLLDCKNCSDEYGNPHQLMHHEGKKDQYGKCMMGELLHTPCQCPGFEAVD
jgi:hypothetical protein